MKFFEEDEMDLKEEIRKVAYELYEKSGCIGGREVENWVAAEKIVLARHARLKQSAESQPAKKVTKPKVGKATAQKTEAGSKKTKTGVRKASASKTAKRLK